MEKEYCDCKYEPGGMIAVTDEEHPVCVVCSKPLLPLNPALRFEEGKFLVQSDLQYFRDSLKGAKRVDILNLHIDDLNVLITALDFYWSINEKLLKLDTKTDFIVNYIKARTGQK